MSNIDKQALRERYYEKPAPNCHICGSLMTIQRAGAGGVVYGCTGRIDEDGEGYKFSEGRDFADDHYARSRVTFADGSDPDVLALLDELEVISKSEWKIAGDLTEAQMNNTVLEKKLEAAEKRIAELEAKLETADKLQDSAFRHGLQHGFSLGQTDNQAGFEQSIQAYGQQWKGE